MKTASFSLARTALLSAAMLLPTVTVSLAEEFANIGTAPPGRYEVTPGQFEAVGRPYGYIDPRAYRPAYRYGNGYGAYGYGFMIDNGYACQLSPGSLEHSACDHQ